LRLPENNLILRWNDDWKNSLVERSSGRMG